MRPETGNTVILTIVGTACVFLGLQRALAISSERKEADLNEVDPAELRDKSRCSIEGRAKISSSEWWGALVLYASSSQELSTALEDSAVIEHSSLLGMSRTGHPSSMSTANDHHDRVDNALLFDIIAAKCFA
jgi:hypothetical protein